MTLLKTTILYLKMIDWIQEFIDSKDLSENSRAAYFYDLQQFVMSIDDKISQEKLALYEQSLSDFKVSVKKRKISAVNQFLFYLYETRKVNHFYKLTNKEKIQDKSAPHQLLDFQLLYEKTEFPQGQLISLLILELGLSPQEIQMIEVADLDLDFAILSLNKSGLIRVLEIPKPLISYLQKQVSNNQRFLFDKSGKIYSRQWFFKQLKLYLTELGMSDLSAQDLRQQFILKKKEEGKSISELGRLLGLKSPITLEKYYKNGY